MCKSKCLSIIIFTIAFLLFFGFLENPLGVLAFVFILGIGYLWLKNSLVPAIDGSNIDIDRSNARRSALSTAGIFVAPYKSIWYNLTLSNIFCSLHLGADGTTITAKEKLFPFRKFTVVNSSVHSYEALWNLFCVHFSHNTTYDELFMDAGIYKFSIYETSEITSQKAASVEDKVGNPVEKLDINNCSEVELTGLPGISIVMSKKAIKKREEIGGFKSVDDFIFFLKLKPHFESQLREKVCVNKMKGSLKKIERYSERRVDL